VAPTQPPIQWDQEVKAKGKADPMHVCHTKFKNGISYVTAPSIHIHGVHRETGAHPEFCTFQWLTNSDELHLSGLIGTASHPDMQKIRIIGLRSSIQINHQPDATVFQFIILTFIDSWTCFRRFPAHHQELDYCSGSLWFYLRIVATVVLCSWSGRYDDARTYKP